MISSIVSGPLDQLLIFRQLYQIELLGFSARLGLRKLWHLLHIRLFTEFGMLVCVTNSKSYAISVLVFGQVFAFSQ